MSEHTKGPWIRHDTPDYAEIHPAPGKRHSAIALVAFPEDADLIAAAPSMLEALKKARGLIDATAFNLHTSLSRNGKRNARPYFDAVAEIDALIAMAEGQP